MARRRRHATRARKSDNSLLTIVLAVGALLLLSGGGLTGFQVRDEVGSRLQYGTPAGSQVGTNSLCQTIWGDIIRAGEPGILRDVPEGTIVATCEANARKNELGTTNYQLCDVYPLAVGGRQAGNLRLSDTYTGLNDRGNSFVQCQPLSEFEVSNTLGYGSGTGSGIGF